MRGSPISGKSQVVIGFLRNTGKDPPVGPIASGAGLRSAVGNVSGYRCVSDCRSRGCEFDPGPAPYFRGD